jgi:hypothetical protein
MPALNPPKIYELVKWLLEDSDNIPENFIQHKTKLNSLVPYITEQLWFKPQLINYLNRHLNDLYNIPDSIEALFLLKKLFKAQKITKIELYQSLPSFNRDIVKAIEEKENYDENNARAKEVMLLQKFHYDEIKSFYIKQKPTKASVKKNSSLSSKKIIEQAMVFQEEQERASIPKSEETIFIDPDKLTQEYITQEELILFDISLLKKTNRVLFIFIDKNNHKKYMVKPFVAKIYVSNQDGVINNDYIEELNPDKFSGYIITDIKLYTKLKYILGHSYKRIVNGDI